MLELVREQGDSESWLPAELAVATAVSTSVEALSWWLRLEQPIPVGEVTDYLHHLTMAPVLPGGDFPEVVN